MQNSESGNLQTISIPCFLQLTEKAILQKFAATMGVSAWKCSRRTCNFWRVFLHFNNNEKNQQFSIQQIGRDLSRKVWDTITEKCFFKNCKFFRYISSYHLEYRSLPFLELGTGMRYCLPALLDVEQSRKNSSWQPSSPQHLWNPTLNEQPLFLSVQWLCVHLSGKQTSPFLPFIREWQCADLVTRISCFLYTYSSALFCDEFQTLPPSLRKVRTKLHLPLSYDCESLQSEGVRKEGSSTDRRTKKGL